ncbi:hypothetical protein PG990_008467 [Apiospora arundinis]|uniref:FabD/lysophospholipase-like protein n=1 Tax=Apiospora arundinis TaxID=335852 RepID=A0ABR2JMV6_9PEZI
MASNDTCTTCQSPGKHHWICVQCSDFAFCDSCWSRWPLHQPGRVGYDGKPHEKANAQVVNRLRNILQPQWTPEAHEEQLQQDDDTTWFGIDRDSSNKPIFQDYGRFATLMGESKTLGLNDGVRYPQLVSFIGQTGAGKSTIIKLLIDHHTSQEPFPSPVTSSSDNDRVPTTGDVHLYADPESYKGRDPMLLLYTFSDVVVFVLRNARAFASTVLEKLLRWGQSSIDKSVNQPTLPHAVIVLNATDQANEKEWDVSEATRLFLEGVRDAVNLDPQLKEYVQTWHPRQIKTTEELLGCYYASITVVRVPVPPRFMLIDTQVGKLFDVIQKNCEASHIAKKQARMLATADQLQMYLHAAYDHFALNLYEPFDFVKETLKHSPISRDFGGNILKLALLIKEHHSWTIGSTKLIFDQLGNMVAHCVFLEAVRQGRMGNIVKLLDDAYGQFCKDALRLYIELYTPCNYLHPIHGQCVNFKNTHDAKGHQNSRGKVIGNGSYVPDLDYPHYEPSWMDQIRRCLNGLQARFNKSSTDSSESQSVAVVHLEFIDNFFSTLGDVSLFKSNTACFCCLQGMPEYPLPCGHILCRPCVEAHATKSSRKLVLHSCPLHTAHTSWEPGFVIPIAPPFSGVRVLCLDGGGVRGIAELQVLKAIEKELGSDLHIQDFLDLIVGTSTGGIIALGLGVRKWSVDECIDHFKNLCREAFQPRELVGIPFLEHMAVLNHGSMYKTKPFQNVLQNTFKCEPLFGDTGQDMKAPIKVAITTATSVDQHPVVLANYSRPDPTTYELPYEFHRPDVLTKEFKVWEAARATSAAPPFFKVFTKEDTSADYMDGAIYYNNPVRVAYHEQRLVSEKKPSDKRPSDNKPPDILISIGTGTNDEIKEKIADHAASNSSQREAHAFGNIQRFYRILAERFDYLLGCNRAWKEFVAEMTVSNLSDYASSPRRRMLRVDPDLKSKVPRLDDVGQVDAIEDATKSYMKSIPARTREIAHKLVASTFFFDKDTVKQGDTGFQCTGTISNRFEEESDEMRGIGDFLLRCIRGDVLPYFVVQVDEDEPWTIPISNTVLTDMKADSYPDSTNSHIPISGFPRRLAGEDTESNVNSAGPKQLSPLVTRPKANTY